MVRASSQERFHKSKLALEPGDPLPVAIRLARAIAEDKMIIGVGDSETEVPAGIFLVRLGVCRNAASAKLSDQPASQVVAVAALVNEIVPRLRRIESRALERDDRANIGHSSA